ncbi:MAG: hypothetical protein IKT98_11980 [Selenomonadaceae bacterium]|nr:hypothetical protein [Selenomonadaceae bacterium]
MRTPNKISQKGAGMLEYALMFGFVAAVFMVAMVWGGFGDSVGDLFDSSGESVNSVEFSSGNSESSSEGGDVSVTTADVSASVESVETPSVSSKATTAKSESLTPTYKPLNWVRDIIPFADGTYRTIVKSDTADKALSSEIGFFNTLLTFAEGGLASTNAADGTKDWESFLNMVSTTKEKNNYSSVYVRDEQKITVKTVGKDLRITYADKEGNYYYKFSPDANNVMQIETNSSKSYGEFFKYVISNADGGGWSYGK